MHRSFANQQHFTEPVERAKAGSASNICSDSPGSIEKPSWRVKIKVNGSFDTVYRPL
jgi:hypothetical protein